MVGTIVLYHREADAPGEAAIVVGINPPALESDTDGAAVGAETLNLLVLPDADGPSDDEIMELADQPDAPVLASLAWFPYRATEVPRDQDGKASGPYWSPVPAEV